ncbi:MAG: DUF192 domain-containing protein [Zoogloeaceae bacterium]|nr:DUF192 domain-containing protein [Zoogloeaceae bacterium]
MRKIRQGAVLLVAACLAPLAVAQSAMPRMELTAGFYRIEAEVAAAPETRMTGLMRRNSMAENHGMLFVFPTRERHCMWMQNTWIPLSVAFLDDSGAIINIRDMAPQTETSHCADAPARFALEMNQSWFARKGIRPGMKIGNIDKAPPPQ